MSGYAAIGLLAGLAVAVGILHLRQTDQRYSYLLAHEQAIAMLATRMEDLSQEQMLTTRGYLLTGADSFLERRQELVNEMAALHMQLVTMVADTEDQPTAEYAWRLTDDFQELAGTAIRIRSEVDPSAALKLYETQVEPLGTRVTAAHRRLVEAKTRQATIASAELQQQTQQATTLLAVLAGAAIFIGMALGALISRGLVASLHQVLAGVQAVERGDLQHAVVVKSGDETEQLAEGVNRMRGSLLELERLRADFVSMISHELRAPVATIYSFSVLLARESHVLSREDLATYLGAVGRQAEQLIKLVDDFVTVERLDSGRLSYAFSPVQLSVLLDEVSHDFHKSHPSKTIIVQQGDGPGVVQADAMRLKQVLMNVVDNVVRLSPDTPVVLGWEQNGGRELYITVADQGLHVLPEQAEGLFVKFGRVQNAKNGGSARGSGLGLYIAKRIVEAHGGAIRVETTDSGSIFSIAMPYTPLPETAAHATPTSNGSSRAA
jgi:signal transduction histidine kinase